MTITYPRPVSSPYVLTCNLCGVNYMGGHACISTASAVTVNVSVLLAEVAALRAELAALRAELAARG